MLTAQEIQEATEAARQARVAYECIARRNAVRAAFLELSRSWGIRFVDQILVTPVHLSDEDCDRIIIAATA